MKHRITGIFHKQSREVRDFKIDMGPKLDSIADTARILNPVVLAGVVSGLTVSVTWDNVNRRINFNVAGGIELESYHIEALFYTSNGQVLEVDILVVVIR